MFSSGPTNKHNRTYGFMSVFENRLFVFLFETYTESDSETLLVVN